MNLPFMKIYFFAGVPNSRVWNVRATSLTPTYSQQGRSPASSGHGRSSASSGQGRSVQSPTSSEGSGYHPPPTRNRNCQPTFKNKHNRYASLIILNFSNDKPWCKYLQILYFVIWNCYILFYIILCFYVIVQQFHHFIWQKNLCFYHLF